VVGERGWRAALGVAFLCAGLGMGARQPGLVQAPSAPVGSVARPLGTIKSVSGNTITMTTEAGSEVTVLVGEATKLLRIAPDQKDLKDAVTISLGDLLPGDRILVRGQLDADGKSVRAASVIAMKKEAIAQKQAQERDEWQRHGVGGLVGRVDAGTGNITVLLPSFGEKKEVTIHVSKDTVLRRYASDSVKFDDAKPAPLPQINAGDQLRARGTRRADGGELSAVEVVSGTFRNISGTIAAIDASANSLTLQDLATKKTITVKISTDSLVRKLPAMMAQRIAMRLKGLPADAPGAAGAASPRPPGAPGGGSSGYGGPGGAGRGGPGGDLQQALSRMPASTLADFQKGDAVMIVATESGPNGVSSVITLLGGVEPILQASPNSSATILTPWSLSGVPGGEAGNP